MKVPNSLKTLTIRCLSQSMSVQHMIHLTKSLIHNYDINKRSGFPDNIPIPTQDAARQIVTDIIKEAYFPHFISLLVDVHYNGLMGRQFNIAYLREIIVELKKIGFMYDREKKMFVEDSSISMTRNWGVFREGDEHVYTFIRLDIVKSSSLVRKYAPAVIKKTYNDLHDIVKGAIEKRNGRIWSWEGDGGLIAFYFSKRNLLATLSAMEIIHEIFMYNLFHSKLDKELQLRIAVNDGVCTYSHNEENIKNSDVVKKIFEMESKYTKPNSITISDLVHAMLDPILVDLWEPIKTENKKLYYNYQIRWES